MHARLLVPLAAVVALASAHPASAPQASSPPASAPQASAPPASSPQIQPAPQCAAWFACMNEAVAAVQKGEHERFHDLAWRAVQLGPRGHVPLMYLLARAQALSGRAGDSLVTLERLVRMGVPTNARTEDHFKAARGHARWKELEGLIAKAAAPVSAGETAFTLPERDLVPEALTFDPAGQRFLVGSLYRRKVVAVDRASGRVTDFATHGTAGFDGVLGLRVDAPRHILWVASAALAEMEGFQKSDDGRSHLHAIDLRTGRPIAKIAPAGEGPHLLNDLAIARSGDVFVTDSAAGVVHRLDAATRQLAPFVTIGASTYPNGIALDAAERNLYVASFAGISRVDLQTKAVTPVVPGGDIALGGVDGLYVHERALLAVQNSLSGLMRVARFPLDASGARVTGVEVLESNVPDYNFPTTGTIVGDEFYYIASSQLRSFESPGQILPLEKLQESTVRRISLTRR